MPRPYVAIICLCGFTTLLAAEPIKKGDRVIAKSQVILRVPNKVVETVDPESVLQVESTNGDWLWVKSPSGKLGWVLSTDVAPAPVPPAAVSVPRGALSPKHDELSGADVVLGELVVTVHQDTTREEFEQALKSLRHDTKILDVIAASYSYLINVPSDVVHECRLRLGIHPYVEACGLNTITPLNRTYDDPVLAEDNENGWNLRRINAPQAWDITTGGAKIAIVDSGIKADHDEFRDKLIEPFSVYTASSEMQVGLIKLNRQGTLVDGYITQHGTHVAGTAAGKAGNAIGTAGIAPDSPIMPIQSLSYVPDLQGIYGEDWALIQGLNRAMDYGAKVINYSVGGPPPAEPLNAWRTARTPEVKDAAEAQIMNWVQRRLNDDYVGVLDRAVREGVIIVTAAGNDDLPAKFDHLSYSHRVISVAATSKQDGRAIFGEKSASNYGEDTTVSAPGQEIWSTYANPEVPYGTMQGTSMAAPHVAGLVGLMKTIDPELSRREAADILVATGEQLQTDQPIGPLVNAAAAVAELKRRRDANEPRPEPDPLLTEPRPDPTNPVLPGNGTAIIRGPRPWQNPDVRRMIDLWLSIALPVIGDRDPANGPFFFDRFGRVISIQVVYTILPPDYAATRYQWLWTNAATLISRNFGSLSVFVIDMMNSGSFNPAPVPADQLADNSNNNPSPANGVHAVTTTFKGLAGSFVWKQGMGADTAAVTFTMNGPEGALLQQHGLPATVTVTAKKAGNTFTVPASNPLSAAISAASANLSRSVGGVPAKFNVDFVFTPSGKAVGVQSNIKVGG